jgi:hypothetical protein
LLDFSKPESDQPVATLSEARPNAQPILRRLQALRRSARAWVLFDGMARVLLLAAGLAVADMGLDRLFKMDRPQRTIMLFLLIGGLLVVAYRRLIRPLLAVPSDEALVLEVERKNPETAQNLIAGLQLSRAPAELTRGMSPALVGAAISAGNRRAEAVDFRTALNRPAAARNRWLLLAGAACCTAIGVAAASNDFVQTWFNRNILLGNRQWPQATYLEIVGVVDGQLFIDRGADCELKVVVSEASRVQSVPVQVEFDLGAKRTTQPAAGTGRLDGREHQLILRAVNTEFRLRALGGDAITPWVTVRLSEPLEVRGVALTVELPDYISGEQPLTGSGPHSVVAGSRLRVEVESNLEVSAAQLKWDEAGLGSPVAADAAGGRFAMERIDPTHYQVRLADGSSTPLRGGRYSIELLGEQGRKNVRPTSFQIAIAPDRPPKIAATLSGIGGLVVPRARVPITFKAVDRYGLVSTAVSYLWKASDESAQTQTGTAVPRTLAPADVTWSPTEQEFAYAGSETFELQPLAIPAGQVLRFTIDAQDNQRTPAGVGKSREFLLRVVTEEELRADLLRREIEQRNLFQLERTAQLQLLTDVRALAAAASAVGPIADRQQLLIEFQNRQKTIGTNAYQVAQRFAEFLEEAKNNRLDESEAALSDQVGGNQIVSLQTRYAERIIEPILALDATEIYLASQAFEEVRGHLSDAARFAETAGQIAELHEGIIRRMDQILAAMEDSQTYQEIVNQVIALKRQEQGLLDSIKNKQTQPPKADIFDAPNPDPTHQPPQPPPAVPKNDKTPEL